MSVILSNQFVAIERLIAAALAFVGFKEVADNRGQVVARFLKGTGLPEGYAWCAAFIYHVGYWSQYNTSIKKSGWPLPATAGCKELGKAAIQKEILVLTPERGDVFLKYFPQKARFAHAGIILWSTPLPDGSFSCTTIEGNTNYGGSREGDSVLIKTRILNPNIGDRFIRWIDLCV